MKDHEATNPGSTSDLAAPVRHVGHDHLVALGFSSEMIGQWCASGLLRQGRWAGFYEYSPIFDMHGLARRRVIGRAHLLALGASANEIRRWQRVGVLRSARDRGFYTISTGLFAWIKQRSPQAAPVSRPEPATPAPPCEGTGEQATSRLRIVACTITRAREYVDTHHRHHRSPVSGLFAVGVARGAELVGVAIVGRPVARELQDGLTAEVTRVCTVGDRNACSMLLSACRRSSIALGYHRLITYTLASEPGTSLRAAGWHEVAKVRGRSWNCSSRPRCPALVADKRRWEAPLPAPMSAPRLVA